MSPNIVPSGYSLTCTDCGGKVRSAFKRASSSAIEFAPTSFEKRTASWWRQRKQGRCPAARAVASSRKKSSVYFRSDMTGRCQSLNFRRQMIHRVVGGFLVILKLR